MTVDFPDPVRHHLMSRLVHRQFPAFFFVARDGALTEWGGDCERYALGMLKRGMRADEIDFLAGMLPLDGEWFCLPRLVMGKSRIVDVHFLPGDGGDWVVLLDTTAEAVRERQMQQQANDLSLLKLEHLKMLDRLRANNENLLAVFNQLRLTTSLIDKRGDVLFLSRVGLDLLHADAGAVIGRHWRDVFSFNEADARQFEQLLAVPCVTGERFRVSFKSESGRPRSFDVDVQTDPRDATQRIVYFYDISDLIDLRHKLQQKASFQDMVGKSHAMQQVFQLIHDVARVDATVLIEGETGTGKELVARAIHDLSLRKDGPFIVVNCAGLADSLINSQLFGHKKGAFTGAMSDQKGIFEAAHGGTILLDEIGDIPMNTQTRILRALEQREIIRVGETQPRKVNIRILAATNKDLEAEVKKEHFRLDLLYRIRVVRVMLPPLRARREDIPLLTEAFVHELCVEYDLAVPQVSRNALSTMMAYAWPGNVRELRNAIEFALIRCKEAQLRLRDLPPELNTMTGEDAKAGAADVDTKKARIVHALRETKGRRGEAAKLLGISRATLYRKMKACCIDDDLL